MLFIEFEGEQETYDTNGGLEIYIKLAIETDVTTPTHTDEIKMTYTNENKNAEKTTSTQIKFESEYGLMIYNQIFDYNENGDDVELINDEETTIELDKEADSKELQVRTYLINNHDKEIENIVYIGKIPAESSNNTFTATLNSVKTDGENVKIYYSTNIAATENDESWTEDNTDAVAYKLVIEKMESEEKIKISTKITIPENLGTNQEGEITQDVSYLYNETEQTRNAIIGLVTESEVIVASSSTVEDLENGETTEVAEGLDVTINAVSGNEEISDGDSIYEGETVKYYITITNNTGEDLSNVSVSTTQTNGKVWGIDVRNEYNPYYYEYQDYYYYDKLDTSELDIDTIETLASGDSATLEYEAYANNLEDCDGTTMYGTIEFTTENETISTSINTISNEIEEAEIILTLLQTTPKNRDDYVLYTAQSLEAKLNITNMTDKTLTDFTVTIVLSDTLTLDTGDIGYGGNDEDTETTTMTLSKNETDSEGNQIVQIEISELEPNEETYIVFYSEPNEIDGSIDSEIVSIYSYANNGENIYYSNELTDTAYNYKNDITVTQDVYVNGNILTDDTILVNGDTVESIITITNNEDEDMEFLIEDIFVLGINIGTATQEKDGEIEDVLSDISSNNYFRITEEISANSSIKLDITSTINTNQLMENEFTNTVSVTDLENIVTYDATVILTAEEIDDGFYEEDESTEDETETDDTENESTEDETETDNTGNDSTEDETETDNTGSESTEEDTETNNTEDDSENTENTNSNDTNSDNINSITSDSTSSSTFYTVSGIVWLDENKDGQRNNSEDVINGITIRVIDSSGEVIDDVAATGSDGTYSLSLEEGTYTILFLYDTSTYSITTYQASGVSDSVNSDAIKKSVTIDGTSQTVAATDNISLTSNTTNIDLGLIENSEANLSIAKYVSKIVVSNSTGTTTYDQDDEETLAKVEIGSKVISGSSVTIEYVIEITNSGESEGDIGTIVDYLPSALSFSTSLNSDWYQSGEYIYNSTLANEEIDTGETKEISLILTKTMTESNTGLINNKTGLLSSDDEEISTASAEVMIGIKTGTIITYISLIIVIVIAVFGISYFVNKKILEEKINF